jgi:hypothetical protein
MTLHEVPAVNQQAETVRMRHEELDREIEAILAERRLDATTPSRPALPTRARAGLGRGLISLGTALVGRADSASSTSSQRLGGRA